MVSAGVSMQFLDQVIGAVSPTWGLRRARARRALEVMASFDAAEGGRRSGWRVSHAGPNAEGRHERGRLRNIGRDLVRNHEWGGAVVDAIVSALVGEGIVPSVHGMTSARARTALEQAMVDHFDTPAIDADGRCDLYGLQALVLETVVTSGECLVRRRWRRPSDGLPLPYQMQVLEPDFLDSSKLGPVQGGLNAGGYIRDGIEFNALGQRVAYWLFPEHPQDGGLLLKGLESKRVPATDVAHVYLQRRPGAMRGVSWLARVAQRLYDFGEFEDAQLMRQKLAACFVAFEIDADLEESAPLSARKTDAGEQYDTLEPGMIARLPPGREITFGSPPGVDGYDTYTRNQLMAIASASGMAYEAVTGDFSGTTYSSARMAYLRQDRTVKQWYQRMLLPTLCVPVGAWFLDGCRLQGLRTEGAKTKWTPPRREAVDPTKEVAAMRDAVRAGQKSPSEVARELGKDPAALFEELAADFKMMDRLGLVLDSDPRHLTQVGGAQSTQTTAPAQQPTDTDN